MISNPKIKIAQVITRMDWGGSPDIVRILCSHLSLELYEVWLISGMTKYPSQKTIAFLGNFNHKVIMLPELRREINPLYDMLALIKLSLLFRGHKFDLVHTHTAKAGFLGRIAARICGVKKVIHTPHGNNFYGYFNSFTNRIIVLLEKFADYFTDLLVVFTELEKKELITYGVSRAEKIRVVNSAIEFESYHRPEIDPVKKRKELGLGDDAQDVVAMIGRLEPVKGPEYFIQAAKLVSEKFPQVKFLLIGDGSLKEKLKSLVGKLNIQNKVIFCGWREDIPEILSTSDILVLASLNEAVGRILIEAGYCGVPVVATNVAGVAEIVRDGVTGILVKPKEPESLAQGILMLLEDKRKRLKMSQAAREWVMSKFSLESMLGPISQIYEGSGSFSPTPHPER